MCMLQSFYDDYFKCTTQVSVSIRISHVTLQLEARISSIGKIDEFKMEEESLATYLEWNCFLPII